MFTEKPDIVPFSFGRETIDQGKFAQLTCVVSSGDRPLSITWSLKGDIVSSDDTMTTTMLGTQASMLVIQSVDYQHSGFTPVEQKILLGSQHIQQNLKSMVILVDGTENVLFTEKPDIVPFSFGRETIDQGKFAQLSCVVSSGDMPIIGQLKSGVPKN